MADTETLADKARKIGEDVAGVWSKIQEKGGVIPHKLNTGSLQDVIGQIYGINRWGANGVFLYNYTGAFNDFYTKTEVAAMTELPPLPEGATGWPKTLAQLKADVAANDYIIMIANGAYGEDISFVLNLTNASYLSPTVYFTINGNPEDVVLRWGDGSAQLFETSGNVSAQHTYSSTGEYTVVVSVSGDETTVKVGSGTAVANYASLLSLHGSTESASYRSYINNVSLSSKVTLGYAGLGVGYLQSSNLVNNSISELSIANYPTVVPPYAFAGVNWTEHIIPDGVTTIGERAFWYNANLTTVRCPNSLKIIGESAFEESRKLETILVPNATAIGKNAFRFCTKASFSKEFLESLTNIGTNAFYYTGDTESTRGTLSISPNSNDTNIDSNAFSGMQGLKVFDATNSSKNYNMTYCSYLTEYKFPQGVTTLISSQFSYCKRLEKIVVPEGVTTLPNNFLYGANDVSGIPPLDLTLPSTLKEIRSSALSYMGSKQAGGVQLSIPASVTSIKNSAMNNSAIVKIVFEGQMPNVSGAETVSCGFNQVQATLDLSNCTSIPTITSGSIYTTRYTTTILPDDLYDQWIVAPVWSTLPCHYVKASEV